MSFYHGAIHHGPGLPMRPCDYGERECRCGRIFVKQTKNQKYCGKRCEQAASKARAKVRAQRRKGC